MGINIGNNFRGLMFETIFGINIENNMFVCFCLFSIIFVYCCLFLQSSCFLPNWFEGMEKGGGERDWSRVV